MSTKHTQTPWKAVTKARYFNGARLTYTSVEPAYDAGPDLRHLAMADGSHHVVRANHTGDPESAAKHLADAAFIVRAVNAHAGLVAALQAIERHAQAMFERAGTTRQAEEAHLLLGTARAALAQDTP